MSSLSKRKQSQMVNSPPRTPVDDAPRLLPSSSLQPAPPPPAHLFNLVPGLLTGSLPILFSLSVWLLWTFVIPLALLLLSLHSAHASVFRTILLTMSGTGLTFLLVSTLPFSLTLLSLRSTSPPASPPLAHTGISPCAYRIHVSHALVIVNPTAGHSDNRAIHSSLILPFLTSRSIQCTSYFTERPGHGRSIACSEDLTSYQCIVVVGGDGTLHEVVNGLMARKDQVRLPIAIIPLGTGNAVGIDLGILDMHRALERIVAGEVCYIDLNHITSPSSACPLSIYSVAEITWGLIGTVAVQAELPVMRRLGRVRLDLCGVWNVLKGFSAKLDFRCPSLSLSGPFVTVYLNNTQHFAPNLRAAPYAVLDDGKMDVLMLEKGSRSLLLALFVLLASGAHVGGEGVRYLQEEKVWMRPWGGRGVMGVDGQIVEFEGEFTVRCMKKVLPLMMEEQVEGDARAQRPSDRFVGLSRSMIASTYAARARSSAEDS